MGSFAEVFEERVVMVAVFCSYGATETKKVKDSAVCCCFVETRETQTGRGCLEAAEETVYWPFHTCTSKWTLRIGCMLVFYDRT